MQAGEIILDRGRPAAQGWPSHLATALFAVVFYFVILRLGRPPADAGLDPSWSAVLIWAAEHGIRFGDQLIYTYGPLGYLHQNARYDPEIFDTYIAGQLLMGLGYTFVYTLCFRALAPPQRLLFVVSIGLFAPWLQADALVLSSGLFAVVALDRLIQSSSRWSWAGLIVLAVFMNALSLMKFSIVPTAALLCSLGVLLYLRDRRPFEALALALIWILSGLALWLTHGQYLEDLPRFINTSLLMMSDYGAAMGTDGTMAALVQGVVGLVLSSLALLLWLKRESPRDLRVLALSAYLAFTLYVFWRAAYTRADDGHTVFFLPQTVFLVFVLCALGTQRLGRLGTMLAVAALLGMAVTVLLRPGTSWASYADLPSSVLRRASQIGGSELHAQYRAQREALQRKFDLPEVRKRVGNARIDLFGTAQGVLMLNGFNYAPRPIFQSYAAYAGALQRINEAYYLGDRAPPYVLMQLHPIDQHYPSSDDGMALLALLRTYRPVVAEKGFLLFRRDPTAVALRLPEFNGPFTRLGLNEWTDVNAGNEARLVYLRYRPSPLGSLRALTLREAKLQLEVQDTSGHVEKFLLVRAVANDGFLMTPFLVNEDAYVRWYLGMDSFPVSKIRVVPAEPWHDLLFEAELQVGFAPVTLLDAQGAAVPEDLWLSLHPGFNRAPVGRTGQIYAVIENDAPALFMHAQAQLDFDPPPGSYALAATYGVRAEAAKSAGCLSLGADGIRFQLDLLRAGQPISLYARNINPYKTPAELGPQNAEVPRIDIAEGDRLRLTIGTGESGSGACDWGYVSKFQLQQLASP